MSKPSAEAMKSADAVFRTFEFLPSGDRIEAIAAAIDAAVEAERERIYTIAKDIDERYARRIDATDRILPSFDILMGKRDAVHEVLASIRKGGA